MACDQSSGTAGAPHRSTQGSYRSGRWRWSCDCSGSSPDAVAWSATHAKAAPRVVAAALVGIGQTEHAREEQPFAAAVVLVVEVAPHAAARRHELRLDARDDLRRADEQERRVEPVGCMRERLLPDLVGAEPVADAPQR